MAENTATKQSRYNNCGKLLPNKKVQKILTTYLRIGKVLPVARQHGVSEHTVRKYRNLGNWVALRLQHQEIAAKKLTEKSAMSLVDSVMQTKEIRQAMGDFLINSRIDRQGRLECNVGEFAKMAKTEATLIQVEKGLNPIGSNLTLILQTQIPGIGNSDGMVAPPDAVDAEVVETSPKEPVNSGETIAKQLPNDKHQEEKS